MLLFNDIQKKSKQYCISLRIPATLKHTFSSKELSIIFFGHISIKINVHTMIHNISFIKEMYCI